MSELSASSMLTWYLATKRRMISVVTQPRSREATKPAKEVSACLGNRYWGRTANRSDTRRPEGWKKGHSIDARTPWPPDSDCLPCGITRIRERRRHGFPVLRGLNHDFFGCQVHVDLRSRVQRFDGLGNGAYAVAAAH